MDCTIRVAKTKALIGFAVTAKLICVFVFAYAKSRFSHNETHVVVRIRFTTRSGIVTDCDRGRPVKSIGTVSTLPSF